jgi:hypothetical protein
MVAVDGQELKVRVAQSKLEEKPLVLSHFQN